MCVRMIAFYIMGLCTKTLGNALFVDSTDSIIEKMVVMMRTVKEENGGLKSALVLSYHFSFEALCCKQKGLRIAAMAK
jgi:hypothetical protein